MALTGSPKNHENRPLLSPLPSPAFRGSQQAIGSLGRRADLFISLSALWTIPQPATPLYHLRGVMPPFQPALQSPRAVERALLLLLLVRITLSREAACCRGHWMERGWR